MDSSYNERWERTTAWRERRFGLFIHFGLYSLLGRGEHILAQPDISATDYRALAGGFAPTAGCMDQLAAAARAAGMRYAVLTAKHADGFCLFDSAHTDFNSARCAVGRDLVAEFVSACRRHDLAVGLYYNQISRLHPDCPVPPNPAGVNAARYTEFVHAQVRELLSNYGPVDQLWFDDAMPHWHGEKLCSTELVALARTLQPGIVLSNRLRPGGAGFRDVPVHADSGDFGTPEGNIPPRGVTDTLGRPLPWETCLTLNEHWAHVPSDNAYKSPAQIIVALIECVSKGGNLLLNVGPDARGLIEAETPILASVGHWVRANAAALFGCGPADWPAPSGCYYTQRGRTLYAHLVRRGVGPLFFPGLAASVRSVRRLTTGAPVALARETLRAAWPDDLILDLPGPTLPEEPVTVLEFTLNT